MAYASSIPHGLLYLDNCEGSIERTCQINVGAILADSHASIAM